MCVGMVGEDSLGNRHRLQPVLKIENTMESEGADFGIKQSRNIERKEKSRDAARERRAKESDFFQELEELVPMANPSLNSTSSASVDKTSVIRLALAYLKARNFVEKGLQASRVKEEEPKVEIISHPEVDIFSCLSGFSLVVGDRGEVIFVTNNVHKYIGLSATELTGQLLSDYIHPCDHRQLDHLIPDKDKEKGDQCKEVFVRIKCTVTERGRIINLKQASYKTVKISGKTLSLPASVVDGGLTDRVFMGVVSVLGSESKAQSGVFSSKHSQDLRFLEVDHWLSSVAGYRAQQLLGQSFFELIHSADCENVQQSFKRLKEQGQCETPAYRMLVSGGGWVFVKTCASVTQGRRGKGLVINCQHHQITEVMERDQVLALIQMESGTKNNNEHRKSSEKVESSTSQNKNKLWEPNLDISHRGPQKLMKSIQKGDPDKTASSHPRSVIIEPRQAARTVEKTSKTEDNIPTSKPTSVIVNPRIPDEPRAVTQDLFKKLVPTPTVVPTAPTVVPTAAVNKSKREQLAPRAVTSEIFSKKANPAKSPLCEVIKSITDEVPPASSTVEKKYFENEDKLLSEDHDIFESLLDWDNMEELEMLAPHIGQECFPLKDMNSVNSDSPDMGKIPVFDLEAFEEVGFLDLGKTSPKSSSGESNEKETGIFINPNQLDIMWGDPQTTITHPKEKLSMPRIQKADAPIPPPIGWAPSPASVGWSGEVGGGWPSEHHHHYKKWPMIQGQWTFS